MNVIDKLLFGLLIIMLPLGLIAAKVVLDTKAPDNNLTQDQEEKITAIISKLESDSTSETPAASSAIEFNIIGVTYASESGNLNVSGIAPFADSLVTVSATVIPTENELEAEDEVLGRAVEIRAIVPRPDSTFYFAYPVPENTATVELRFEQKQSIHTLRHQITND